MERTRCTAGRREREEMAGRCASSKLKRKRKKKRKGAHPPALLTVLFWVPFWGAAPRERLRACFLVLPRQRVAGAAGWPWLGRKLAKGSKRVRAARATR